MATQVEEPQVLNPIPQPQIARARAGAFTVVEVLVVIGCIALIAGLILPVIANVRESARRTEELACLRQLTAACIVYARENNDLLPVGRMSIAASTNQPGGSANAFGKGTGGSLYNSGATAVAPKQSQGDDDDNDGYPYPGAGSAGDDYTWINYTNCWRLLTTIMPGLYKMDSCLSVRSGYAFAEGFGKPWPNIGYPDDTQIGWIYWGGRDDLYVNGKLQYRSMRRLGQHVTPGSPTLWTCWCWDSAGKGGPSSCPHVGNKYVSYPNGVELKPTPDGLCVGLDDGSASFQHWSDMIIIPQANGYKLYYQP
jgi:type II secretory pathway pseudopilin PulG